MSPRRPVQGTPSRRIGRTARSGKAFLLLLALPAAALLPACAGSDGDEEKHALADLGLPEPDGGGGPGVLTPVSLMPRLVSGFITDARSGRPLQGVLVGTVPPSDTVMTNSSGLYVLSIGQGYGPITVQAGMDGYRPAAACVVIGPQLNAVDLALSKLQDGGGGEMPCNPECAAGELCAAGVCATRCDPPCGCNQHCTAEGTCEAEGAPPACGMNSRSAGAGLCLCDPGTFVTSTERSCVPPEGQLDCPPGATPGPDGCTCPEGQLWADAVGEEAAGCKAAEAVIWPDPLQVAALLGQWRTPGRAPRGLVFDGEALWVGDALDDSLYRLQLRPGSPEPEVLQQVPLDGLGYRLRDMAFADGQLYLLFAEPQDRCAGSPEPDCNTVIQRLDLHAPGGPTRSGLPFTTMTVNGLSTDGRKLYFWFGQLQTLSFDGVPGREFRFWPGEVDGVTVQPELGRYLAYNRNQLVSWVETTYDGTQATARLMAVWPNEYGCDATDCSTKYLLPAANLRVPVDGMALAGMDAAGSDLWLLVAGDGARPPRILWVRLK